MADDSPKSPAREAPSDEDSNASSSDDDSDSGAQTPAFQVEWLATGRERRSTAGNRMKSMLANEEPDSDMELLFAEDEDDAGFTDVGKDDGSDVHMESSSDEEDSNEAAAEDEGEKELLRQAREKKLAAARKRKAQDAIPMKFRKKVRISQPADSTAGISTTAAPARPPPRPKKKSERTSWLPTASDAPTRASERRTTKLSKEQLHQQMIEREAKRVKQLEIMERKAKKAEAMKKPALTQQDRLKEAAAVEKRNSKSLNRWEEAEKQREEERRAKLAALNNRRLEGPVVTFWSGLIDLSESQLKHVGKMVSIEEKPRKKRQSVAAAPLTGQAAASPSESAMPTPGRTKDSSQKSPAPGVESASSTSPSSTTFAPISSVPFTSPTYRPNQAPPVGTDFPGQMASPTTAAPASMAGTTPGLGPPVTFPHVKPDPDDLQTRPHLQRNNSGPRLMAPPSMPQPSQASVLAPPAGMPNTMNGSMPMLGFSSSLSGRSNFLAAPNTSQSPSPAPAPTPLFPPPPAPQTAITPQPSNQAASPPVHTTASFQHIHHTIAPPKPLTQQVPLASRKKSLQARPKTPANQEPSAPEPPLDGKVTRTCIILQNFDDDAVKQPAVQTRILFGRNMTKLAKPPHPPLCVITNHPARYRDPRTGLPYHDAYAFKEIQRLASGEFKWSRLTGSWVGTGAQAAKGVPDRFLHPENETEKQAGEGQLAEGVAAGSADGDAAFIPAPIPKNEAPATGPVSAMMPTPAVVGEAPKPAVGDMKA